MGMIQLHKMARTTPVIRKEIHESTLSERELTRKYNITRETVRKWKKREDQADRSHRPHKMHTTLSRGAEKDPSPAPGRSPGGDKAIYQSQCLPLWAQPVSQTTWGLKPQDTAFRRRKGQQPKKDLQGL
ncbi:MAG: hypothetical protein K6360_08900 [Deltaproteobacteria bacterium]